MSDESLGNLSAHDLKRLDVLHDFFVDATEMHLGNPGNLLYDYSDLHRFFAFTINNIGDPFADGLYQINTHLYEREVIDFFSNLYHAPKQSYWGYVTNGGTEGNMYALYIAREYLPDGIVYFSKDVHYSVPKAQRIMGFKGVAIDSQENGEIDYKALEKSLREHGKPPIIVATIGTTMKGAIDNVERIVHILQRNKIKDFYIHCDAALGGMILPFIDKAPPFDFRLPISSISVSGHKMIGCPISCGIVIARKEHVDRVQKHIEIIGAPDTTLSGSRNGHSVLFLWYAIKKFGVGGFEKMVHGCFDVRDHALKLLREISWEAYAGKLSVIIVIKRPSEQIVKKWQLAVHGQLAHLVIMPNVSKIQIDAFVEDLKSDVQRRANPRARYEPTSQ